ncbi:sensor histidine kinase [Clostridium felsineum]|uniref:histidine kinase n=1 Tax=Clostridium felsineum TaxID=36839 RepID=A0A1S8LP99_9CLOT|nr:HAMP domain-containing sensor histidine kinase [Clostridium felsineum]URZ04859.1 Adaptive-response sensory-kinase SasA [Clostridium felsineum]URZ09900.1 Adaptive-response sensory-kinase SasA [Clostridium felsineum]
MSIKTKLVLSNIAMCIIPLALCIVTLLGLDSVYTKKLHTYYNIEDRRKRALINPYMEIKSINLRQLSELESKAEAIPDNFQDGEFLKSVNAALLEKNSYIVVEKNNKVIFNGSKEDNKDIINKLDDYNYNYNADRPQFSKIENNSDDSETMVRQIRFAFSDGGSGIIFLVIDTSKLSELSKEFIISIVIAIIAIVSLTSALITFLVSRSILIPLTQLKIGTEKIKDGDLSFEVKAESRDEIGELCNAFDDMRKRLKESVELQLQYEDNRKELISNISHDLKTPITSIKGYVEGIKDGVADTPEKMEKYVNTIYNKAQSMNYLIEELLTYSKLDLKKLPFYFIDIDFVSYMDDLMEEVKFDVEKNNIEFHYDNSIKGKAIVRIDVQNINRVITNIVSNSIKYMDKEHGKILVEMLSSNEDIIVGIKDNGMGISKEALLHVFDRFYREDFSRNTSKGGSGLGLAICKKIIEEHGGKIWAKSQKGNGTEIWFSIKLKS